MKTHQSGGYIVMQLDREFEVPGDLWKQFIDQMKQLVPEDARHYYDHSKEWLIEAEYWPAVRDAHTAMFNEIFNRGQITLNL